ncbi:MAG: Nramp family divalent metal transporter [Spirochaetaceae bacterium]|nr:Nramp family divalent metal transporter [Spirochaetaceae bacterium]
MKDNTNQRLKKIFSFMGPGFLITVGFIDPGNWATNIEGGSRFGYSLLWVVTLSTIMLMVIQHTAAKMGIATGKSLAVNIREQLPKPLSVMVGITVVLACVATDVAELLGGAIGFNLLLRMPLWLGAVVTIFLEIFLIIGQRYHKLEKTIIGFLGIIALCYVAELIIVKPDWGQALPALVIPKLNKESIYISLGIIGAVVMPHNIFLHSNVIHSRNWGITDKEKMDLLKYERIDTTTSLSLGLIVNAAMIIVAAKVFSSNGIVVTSITDAAKTLVPLAGKGAGFLFALALVFAGVGSSVTSSMAEVNVITGFLGKPEDPKTLLYRVATFITAIPSLVIILLNLNTYKILIFSQVILSIQLPFTLIPLLYLARKKSVMGIFKSSNSEFIALIVISAIIISLNTFLLFA